MPTIHMLSLQHCCMSQQYLFLVAVYNTVSRDYTENLVRRLRLGIELLSS